jgi:hypothetical protein
MRSGTVLCLAIWKLTTRIMVVVPVVTVSKIYA